MHPQPLNLNLELNILALHLSHLGSLLFSLLLKLVVRALPARLLPLEHIELLADGGDVALEGEDLPGLAGLVRGDEFLEVHPK